MGPPSRAPVGTADPATLRRGHARVPGAGAYRWAVGVDGARGGWVLVLRELGSGACQARTAPSLDALVALGPSLVAAAVDIPIGLPARAEAGGRPCDRAVRAVLPGRAASVFSPPSRAALVAWRTGGDYASVLAASRAGGGSGLSLQAFHLLPRIDDAERVLGADGLGGRAVEVHPEAAFALLAGRMLAAKKTPAGRRARAALLRAEGFPVTALLRSVRDAPGPVRAGVDDLHDACVACWTAVRRAEGRAEALGPGAGPGEAIWR